MFKILILALFISSCGFKPVYNKSNRDFIEQDLQKIKLSHDFSDLYLSEKIILKNVLDELSKEFSYQGASPKYILKVLNPQEGEGAADMDRDGDITEFNYSVSISVQLRGDIKDAEDSDYIAKKKGYCKKKNLDNCAYIIFSKSFSDSLNYNVTESYYASQVAKKSFRKDLAKRMASSIKQEIILNLLAN